MVRLGPVRAGPPELAPCRWPRLEAGPCRSLGAILTASRTHHSPGQGLMVERANGRRKPAGGKPIAVSDEPAERRAPSPKFDRKTIALVYDFDGTLSPRPMQEYAFLPQIGADAAAFWAETNALARRERADPLITYMHLMYRKAKAKGVRIDREDL